MSTKYILVTIAATLALTSATFADDSSSGSTVGSGSTSTWTIVISSSWSTTDSWAVITTTSTGTSTSTGSITSTGTSSTGAVISTGTTSTWSVSDIKKEIEKNRWKVMENWGKFHDDYGFMNQFFKKYKTKKNLKAAQAEVKDILKNYHEEVKAILKEGQDAMKSNKFDPEAFNAKLSDAFDRHVTSLLPYVDPAKTEDFKKFMDAKKQLLVANAELRKANFNYRQEIKKVLSDIQREKIKNKIQKASNKALQKIVDAIDKAIWKWVDDSMKEKLIDLKDILETKIDWVQ